MINIIRRQLERNWPFLLAVMLVLGGFEFLICAMVGTVNVEGPTLRAGQAGQYAP